MRLVREFPKQLIAIAILILVIIAFGYAGSRTGGTGCAISVYEGEPGRIALFDRWRPHYCMSFERAETPGALERGLSGRISMDKTNGMLFVFDEPQSVCLWMKDMKFPLDMIWLDNNKKILKIQPNVTPETYPTSFCAENTRYVIETKAGVAGQAGLRKGQQLKI